MLSVRSFQSGPRTDSVRICPCVGLGYKWAPLPGAGSPAGRSLLLRMVNLWRIEPWASAPGSSLASNHPGSICHLIWGIFAAWLAQGLKRQHKTGHVATLPMGRGRRGSGMKYCDRTLQAPANHSCWGLKSAIHPLVSGSAFLATLLIQRSPFNLKQRLRLSPAGLTAAVKATGRAIVRPLGKNNRTLKGGCGWIGERGLACARGRLGSLGSGRWSVAGLLGRVGAGSWRGSPAPSASRRDAQQVRGDCRPASAHRQPAERNGNSRRPCLSPLRPLPHSRALPSRQQGGRTQARWSCSWPCLCTLPSQKG